MLRSHENMNGINENISDLLQPDMVVDITTRGRKTGMPRRIEIWAHYLEGRIFLASRPGRRSWHANLIEHPEFIFHVKEIQKVDILAKANPLFEKYDRYQALKLIKNETRFQERINMVTEDWILGSCIVEVFLTSTYTEKLPETFS